MKFFTAALAVTGLASLATANPLFARAVTNTVTKTKTTTSYSTVVVSKTKTTTSFIATATVTKTSTVHDFIATTTITKTKTADVVTTVAPAASCLSSDDATYLITGFASLLTAYDNNTANAILADDFSDYSDSINFLAGYPLGSATFPSKAAFEAGQGSQQAIGFAVDAVEAVTCTTIAFRWTAYLGEYPVQGIEIFHAEYNSDLAAWQIQTVYSEFNSGSWMLDIGGTCGFTS